MDKNKINCFENVKKIFYFSLKKNYNVKDIWKIYLSY